MVGKDDKMLPAAAWPSSHRCCLRERPQFWPENSHSCHKFFPHKLERLQFIPPDDFWWNMVISIGRLPEQAGSSSAFGQSSGLPSPHRSCSQLSGSSPPPCRDNDDCSRGGSFPPCQDFTDILVSLLGGLLQGPRHLQLLSSDCCHLSQKSIWSS